MKKILFIIFAYSSYSCTFNNFLEELIVLEAHLQDLADSINKKTQAYPTFAAWKKAWDTSKYPHTPLTFEEFKTVITAFCELQHKALTAQTWLDTQPSDLLNATQPVNGFYPWVEKRVLPAGVQLLFHADIHGDITSLFKYLGEYVDPASDFKLSNPNQYLIFLGDYTDRGDAGTEVLYTLLRLKLANPDHVMLLRGNHEDIAINARPEYGFIIELEEKFKDIKLAPFSEVLNTCYSYMPVALFLGIENTKTKYINYLLCCHGGLEIGYQPQQLLRSNSNYQLITSLNPIATIQKMPELTKAPGEYFSQSFYESDPAAENSIQKLTQTLPKKDKLKEPADIGFLWSDFEVDPKNPLLYSSNRGAGFVFGKNITQALLESYGNANYSVVGIMRGHQQSGSNTPMMQSILKNKGVSTLWQDQDPKTLPKINLYKKKISSALLM